MYCLDKYGDHVNCNYQKDQNDMRDFHIRKCAILEIVRIYISLTPNSARLRFLS